MISFNTFLSEMRKPSEIEKFKKATSHIKSVDSRETEWAMDATTLMKNYGFKTVGAGKYGSVFENPSYPYVIKVFMKDTAYLKWLNFAKEHPNNPYVPKIRGKVVRLGDKFMAVRLEKLTGSADPMFIYDLEDKGDKDAIAILDFFDKHSNLLDLHAGNMMMRGKTPVIIDPFYNFYRGGKFSIDPDDTKGLKNILVKP